MLKDLSNSNIEIWQIKEMLIILTLFGLLLTVVFKNLLRHTCVSISNVIIRSETSRIFSLSESTNAQSLLCNDIMDPDCFEKWRSLLLIRVTTISVWGFTVCNGCCTDLSRFAMSSGHPHKGPVFWSVVHSVTKEYTSHQSKHSFIQFSSVQLLSVWLFASPWTAAHQASLSNTLPEPTQTHIHWVGDAIQPSHPLSSPSLPALNLSQHHGLFKWVSSLHQVAKYWSFSFSISPSNEHPGLMSFRMDWLDLLAVQGTLKSLLQHHSSKPSILWCSALFIVQLAHPYMTTGKTIALTRQTFVGKVISLLF